MLINEKTTGSIQFFFCVKRSVSDNLTIRKNNGEKSASLSSKMREKQTLGPNEPPGHLSVNPNSLTR